MVRQPFSLSEVALAVEDPVARLETWLSFDGELAYREASDSLLTVLVSNDDISLATFRSLAAADGGEPVKVTAERFGVNPSAISQRRTRMTQAISALRRGELSQVQLVAFLRTCISALVCLDDLPYWVRDFVTVKPDGGCNEGDLALLVLNTAVDRPRLIADEGGPWLAATHPDGGDQPHDLKGFAQGFADEMTDGGSLRVSSGELDEMLVGWGVSPLSASRFKTAICYPARRSVRYRDDYVLLDHDDGRNAARTISAVTALLALPEATVVDVMVEQHERKKGSLLNELTNRRR